VATIQPLTPPPPRSNEIAQGDKIPANIQYYGWFIKLQKVINALIAAGGGGGGGVTTVNLNDISTTPIYTTAPTTPATGAVAETIQLKTQAANTVFAGPVTGAAAQPAFRALVAADIPGVNTPFNITSDTHLTLPTGVGVGPNDEFETGTIIDTSGSRYTGATAWTAFNVGTGPTAITNAVVQGSLLLQGGTNSLGGGTAIKGYTQPLISPATYTTRLLQNLSATSPTFDAGIFLSETSSGKAVTLEIRNSGSAATLLVTTWSSPTTAISNIASLSVIPVLNIAGTYFYTAPIYLQIILGTATINCLFSTSGLPGTFVSAVSFATTTNFTVAPDRIGLFLDPISYTSGVTTAGIFDWFRRVA
jgi:hypothetical protein